MNGAHVYAVTTGAAGILLLLGWLYATMDNPKSMAMLRRSVLLFVLPIVVLVMLPAATFEFPLSLWVAAFIEEVLKAAAAKTERSRVNSFLLIILFGFWEITWVKPLWGLNHTAALEGWTALQIAGLVSQSITTVFMHSVTAEIYAFHFRHRLAVALASSWMVHTAFDESINLFGISFMVGLFRLTLLIILFAALWPKSLRTFRFQQSR